ncbi:hypothetical protein Tco_1243446 [Tanacetum coccineum]
MLGRCGKVNPQSIKSDAKGLLEALKSTRIVTPSDPGFGDWQRSGTYRCVLSYRLGVPFFSVPKPCSACSSIFAWNIYGDQSISCVGIVGIKHRHNIVGDTLVDICFRSRISASKEVHYACLSPLKQTGMIDFVPGCAVIEAAKRKRIVMFIPGDYACACLDGNDAWILRIGTRVMDAPQSPDRVFDFPVVEPEPEPVSEQVPVVAPVNINGWIE